MGNCQNDPIESKTITQPMTKKKDKPVFAGTSPSKNTMSFYDTIVIGGGMSGVSCAVTLAASGQNVLII
jgi:ribulose 1,5-bisphosphate synthetase/thiazole synthase